MTKINDLDLIDFKESVNSLLETDLDGIGDQNLLDIMQSIMATRRVTEQAVDELVEALNAKPHYADRGLALLKAGFVDILHKVDVASKEKHDMGVFEHLKQVESNLFVDVRRFLMVEHADGNLPNEFYYGKDEYEGAILPVIAAWEGKLMDRDLVLNFYEMGTPCLPTKAYSDFELPHYEIDSFNFN